MNTQPETPKTVEEIVIYLVTGNEAKLYELENAANYTVDGFEVEQLERVYEAIAAINKLRREDMEYVIGLDGVYLACDDLHLDAYAVQPRIKVHQRQRMEERLDG